MTETNASAVASTEDKRIERLFEYTKFHIGIYLSIAAGIVALLGTANANDIMKNLIGSKVLLLIALGLMFVAGFCGGVVASAATQCKTFEEVWEQETGPWVLKIAKGRHWAQVEHTAFWVSITLLIITVLLGKSAGDFLTSRPSTS